MKVKEKIRQAQDFDYDVWVESQELKDIFPPRVMLLLWVGIFGMLNYRLVEIIVGQELIWNFELLWVSTFISGACLLIGYTLGIEQKKNR